MNKQFLFLIFVGILCLNLVSAGNNVIYNAYYAELNQDGSISYTDTPVTDFQTLGYVCLNSDCSSVGSKIDGLTKTSSGNSVILNFPTSSSSVDYGIWFYKAGYIHWEAMPSSTGSGQTYGPYDVYLIRKQVGWAPIMDMHVINEVHPEIPIEIGLNVSIDADTYSALENAGPLKYNPSELNSINFVETNVNLKIKDSVGNVIYNRNQVLEIPYSESKEVKFNYPGFSNTGVYNIELTTNVHDDKILSSISQFARTEIRVIPVGLTDYSFSFISGLSMNPVSPERNENVDFGFNYISNYIDAFGYKNIRDTNVSVRVYNDGIKISEENSTLTRAEDYFGFSKSFSSLGNYTIIVEGMPAECLGTNGCLSSLQEISFVIKENPPIDTIAPQITVLSPTNNGIYHVSDILLHVSTNENADVWFSLDGGARIYLGSGLDFSYNLVGLNEAVHSLNVYAQDSSNNQRIVSVIFTVDLENDEGNDDENDDSHESIGSREVIYDGNSIANKFISGNSDDEPLVIDLNINAKKNFLDQLFFWIFLILVLILIIISAMLIARRLS